MLFLTVPSPTAIYTLSLHDALPISLEITIGEFLKKRRADRTRRTIFSGAVQRNIQPDTVIYEKIQLAMEPTSIAAVRDRKSTRLNSSHTVISYAVFCLKKKNKRTQH